MSDLSHVPARRLAGSERFRCSRRDLDFSVLDYWAWSASDLLNNAQRGVLAEYLVGKALACDLDSETRTEWDAFDLITPEGITVEVKSAAYLQSWHQEQLSTIRFRIAPTHGWDSRTNSTDPIQRRQAQVYVFALLHHEDKATVDVLDLDQWSFFVLPTVVLDRERGRDESLGLPALKDLGATPVPFEELRRVVIAAGRA